MSHRPFSRAIALLGSLVMTAACGNDRSAAEPDPDEVELKAIDQAASAFETAARENVEQLSALNDTLDERLTDDDIIVLFRNHSAFLEAMASNTQFVPDAAFLALVERLRDLPFFELLPESQDANSELESALRSEHLDRRAGALYISTLEPGCTLPCTLQASTWAMLDLNDTRLEVYSPSVDGAIYCNRLGLGSANPERIIERGDANWLNRTNAKDPFEPSNTMARAWPLRFPTKEIRAYLTKGDVDYYRLPDVGGMMVQLVSPPGEDYDFELMNQDGTKVYTSGKKGVGLLDSAAVCVGCNETPPPTYLVRVYPKDAAQHYSAGRPYVLRILTSP